MDFFFYIYNKYNICILCKLWMSKVPLTLSSSTRSSGRVGRDKKHEIYVAAFGGHLFYDLFLQGWGGDMAPSAPPRSATELLAIALELVIIAKNGYSTHFFCIANANAITKSSV